VGPDKQVRGSLLIGVGKALRGFLTASLTASRLGGNP